MFMKFFQILSIFAILGNFAQATSQDNEKISDGSEPFKLIVSRTGSDIQHTRIGSYKHEFAISSEAHKFSAHIDKSLKLVINNSSMYAKVHADGSISISKHSNIASHGFAIKNGYLSYIGSEGFTAVPKTFGYSILFDPLEKEELQVPGSIPVTIKAIGEDGDVVPDYPINSEQHGIKKDKSAHSKNKRQTEITINPVAPSATTSTYTSIAGTTVVTRTECLSGDCSSSHYNTSSSTLHTSTVSTSTVSRTNTSTATSTETRNGTTIYSSVNIPTTANFVNSTTELLTTREVSTSVQPIFINTTSVVISSTTESTISPTTEIIISPTTEITISPTTEIITAPTTLISSFTSIIPASTITFVVSGSTSTSVIPPSTIVSALTFTSNAPSQTMVFSPVTVTESCPLCIPVTVSISGTKTTTITATSTPAPLQSILTTSVTSLERTTAISSVLSAVTQVSPAVAPSSSSSSSLSSSSIEALSTSATLVTFTGAANKVNNYMHNNVFGTGIVGFISGMIIAIIS